MTFKTIAYKMKSILFSVLFIPLIASTSIAATYYIDSNAGSDSNSGSETQPFKTISKVQSIVSAGDTVYFDSADTWTGTSGLGVLVPVGGVTYIGDSWGSGTRATLKANNNSRAVVYFNEDDSTYETALLGFDCDAQDNNIDVISIFHDGRESNDMTGAIKRIERNLAHNNDGGGGWVYGITVAPNANNQEVSNIEIHDNEVYDISKTGMTNYPYDGCYGCTVTNSNITGNIIHDAGKTGHGHGLLLKNGVSNIVAECNLIYDINTPNFHNIAIEDFTSPPSNLTVRHNIMGNNDSIYIQASPNNFTVSNNTTWPGPPTATPSFNSYCAESDSTPPQNGAPAPPSNLVVVEM